MLTPLLEVGVVSGSVESLSDLKFSAVTSWCFQAVAQENYLQVCHELNPMAISLRV